MDFLKLIIALRRWQDLDDWRILAENYQMPPLEFYARLEAAIRQLQIPDLEISHYETKESGLLSDRRVYLRLRRGSLLFDCCAAPLGANYFFSYWLWMLPRPFTLFHLLGLLTTPVLLDCLAAHTLGLATILAGLGLLFAVLRAGLFRTRRHLEEFGYGLTLVGVLYELFFRKPTYYELDAAAAFHATIRNRLLLVLDELTKTHGLRALTLEERRTAPWHFFKEHDEYVLCVQEASRPCRGAAE